MDDLALGDLATPQTDLLAAVQGAADDKMILVKVDVLHDPDRPRLSAP
jgi:hypothetical protein